LRLFVSGYVFSSRRRHTRLVSDWSSDVCSSDLFGFWPSFKLGDHLMMDRHCKECGKAFVPVRYDQVFHSPECKQIWFARHYREMRHWWKENGPGREPEQPIERVA